MCGVPSGPTVARRPRKPLPRYSISSGVKMLIGLSGTTTRRPPSPASDRLPLHRSEPRTGHPSLPAQVPKCRCCTLHTSLRISFGARSPGLDIVELELYEVAVGISHVQGFSRPSGAYDVFRPAFDLHARVREVFGQCIRVRTFDHQGEVIVTSGGDGLEAGIRPQVQDEPGRYPQRDEGMLPAPILLEAERLETQYVTIETERPLDILHPPVGVISICYLHRLSESFRSASYQSWHLISVGQGRRPLRAPPARRTPPTTPLSSPVTTFLFVLWGP